MDRESKKQEQLRHKYEHLKKKIKDWELAIYKTEGRKPSKDDMKLAPKDVQISYREFVKIKKFIKLGGLQPSPPKNTVMLTPGKIFLGKHRQQLQRSAQSYVTVTPSRKKIQVQQSTSRFVSPPADTSTLGFRSSSNTNDSQHIGSSNDAEKTSQKFSFKKLFSRAGEVRDEVVNEKNNAETPNTVQELIDTSCNEDDNSNTTITESIQPRKSIFGLLRTPNSLDMQFVGATTSKELNANNKEFSFEQKSPISKKGLSFRISNKLDSGWLKRLESGDDDINKSEDLISVSTSDPNALSNCIEQAVSYNAGGSGSSDNSFSNDNEVCANMEVDFSEHSGFDITTIHENSDSGICVSSIFNSDELQQAVDEVMQETRQNVSVSAVSDADASLLYGYSEDACLPSDHEGSIADQNVISNLIKSLDDSCSDKEHSKLTDCSDNSRKRTVESAFSPESEKSQPKRKFFKSSRGERVAKFSMTSYKPKSPVKKKRSKALEHAPTQAQDVSVNTQVEINESHIQDEQNSVTGELAKGPDHHRSVKSKSSQDSKKGSKKIRSKKQTKNDVDSTTEPKPKTWKRNATIDVFNEAPDIVPGIGKARKAKAKANANARFSLESKLSQGRLNENYVRIDTKRKVFVRGHKKVSAVKMKRLEWKQKKSQGGKSAATASFTCNKCGEKGHFAKFCMKGLVQEDEPVEQDDSPFPTLQEAAKMIWKNDPGVKRVNVYFNSESKDSQEAIQGISDECSVDITSLEEPQNETPQLIESVDPFFDIHENSQNEITAIEFEEDVIQQGLREFGYETFRPGQREAISRVLKGLSTLLILSTGSGKSLCYQLPAYLYGKKYPGALTLCISPLVSLMEDQIQGIPAFLNAACLHSNMTTKQKSIVLEKVKSRKLNILLVSPEAVCGGMFGLLKGTGDTLPMISFACIDEVHCVSQWSHNFRPSYLQLCKILREKLHVKTILGLTATATKATSVGICEHLNIEPSTTIRGELIPRNLKLSVSRDVHKDESLIYLLRGERFRNCDSIIIYCTRREECERIAKFVRIQLQEISTTHKIIKTKSRSYLSGSCEAYHAGMTARKRKNVQDGFMSGEIRIVVATVAFGMGIDKSDIRAVIHYNMPSAFESYVQEIGRAGRDGLPAHCHLFLDNTKRNDLCELKRHVYANTVDRPTVRKLLRKVFKSCKCARIEELKGSGDSSKISPKDCSGHEVSFSIEKSVLDLDLPQENITTLLCYLELDERKWIEILPLTYETCKIQSYGGPKFLKAAAARCAPLAVAIALLKEKKKFRETDSFVEFNVIEAAATVGWSSSVVKRELKNLEWSGTEFDDKGNATRFRKSCLIVEFSDLAYRMKSPGSLSDEDADKALDSLHSRNYNQEQTQLYQLNKVYQALLSVSLPNTDNLCDEHDEEKSDQLKNFIYEYFTEDTTKIALEFSMPEVDTHPDKIEDVRQTIRSLTNNYRDETFRPRSVAKIFQGISSPCFPSDVWYRNRDFWRRHLDVDFHTICRIASEEL